MYILENFMLAISIAAWPAFAGAQGALEKKDVHVAVGGKASLYYLPLTIRSEEHTSELQSHSDLVCRLLLEKKKKKIRRPSTKPEQIQPSVRNKKQTPTQAHTRTSKSQCDHDRMLPDRQQTRRRDTTPTSL